MAKAPPTTKGKTKTRQAKPAAGKAARVTKSTKSTKAAAAREARANSPASRPTTKRLVASALTKWHFLSAGIFTLLAVTAAVAMKESTYQLTLGYLTSDVLLSKTNTAFAPAQTVLLEFDLRWLLVGILAISAIFSLLRATRLSSLETAGVARRMSPVRWLDYAVTFALMTEVTALLFGMQDLANLKLMAGLTALGFGLYWISDRENIGANRPVRASYVLALLAGALPLLAIAAYALATPIWGMVRAPWYVYAVFWTVGLTFILGALNQLYGLRRFKSWANYAVVERNSIWLNLLAKTAFAVILIVGLHS